MATAQDAIVHSLTLSKRMLGIYVKDLTPQEYLHRPAPGANCTAWVLGHLILSGRRAMGLLGVSELPTLPEGFEKRFARDAEAPKADEYGDVSILWPLFEKHHDLMIEATARASSELIDKPIEKPHPMFATIGQLATFMAIHTTMHAGQITIIRRSLGRPPLV